MLGPARVRRHRRRGSRLRAQDARRHGEAPSRSRRTFGSVSTPRPLDSSACGGLDRIKSSSVSASQRRCSPSRRASCPGSRTGTTTSTIERPVFIDVPDAAQGRVLRRGLDDAADRRVARLAARPQLRAGRARRPAHDQARTRSAASRDFRAGVWMQTLLRDPAAGVMHSCIYFGFIGLFIATVLLELDHQLPGSLKFLHGHTYEAYASGADLAGVVFLDRHRLGDRAPLRAAPVSHPHQDQARRRGDPRHVR